MEIRDDRSPPCEENLYFDQLIAGDVFECDGYFYLMTKQGDQPFCLTNNMPAAFVAKFARNARKVNCIIIIK